jgi:ferredoxin
MRHPLFSLFILQAGAVIPYKCKKGECGTCKVMIDGKWAQACQTKIPSLGSSEIFQVNIREVCLPCLRSHLLALACCLCTAVL